MNQRLRIWNNVKYTTDTHFHALLKINNEMSEIFTYSIKSARSRIIIVLFSIIFIWWITANSVFCLDPFVFYHVFADRRGWMGVSGEIGCRADIS